MAASIHDDDATSHPSAASSGVAALTFLLYDLPATISRCARVGSRVAFAVSPVAAYLPQYLTLREQARELFSTRQRHAAPAESNGAVGNGAAMGLSGVGDGGGVTMRRAGSKHNVTLTTGGGSRSPYSTPQKAKARLSKSAVSISTCNPSSAEKLRLPLTVSNGVENDDNGANDSGGGWFSSSNVTDASITPVDKAVPLAGEDRCEGGGMSPLSVLILLSSHLLRLLYFHGQVQLSSARRRRSAATARNNNEMPGGSVEDLPYDLVIQSVVMIAVQLLLVKAMAQCRKIRIKRSLDDHNAKTSTCPPASWADDISSLEARHPVTGTLVRTVLSVLRRLAHLLHPARIWNYPTFREHLQFLTLISLTTFLHAEFVLFTSEDNGESGVRLLRNTSVVLESCLALPQLAQNYLRKDTAGLSLIMVVGWISGDFLKLVYFLLQMWGSSGGAPVAVSPAVREAASAAAGAAAAVAATTSDNSGSGGSSGGGDGTMTAFAAGCVLALSLDLMVSLQMLVWYPTPDVMMVRDAIWNAITRHRQKGDSRVTPMGKRAVLAEIVRILMGSTGSVAGGSAAAQEIGAGGAGVKMGANLGHAQPQRSSMLSVPNPAPTRLLRPEHSE